jgi:LSD1 subclass zinc finger protein
MSQKYYCPSCKHVFMLPRQASAIACPRCAGAVDGAKHRVAFPGEAGAANASPLARRLAIAAVVVAAIGGLIALLANAS